MTLKKASQIRMLVRSVLILVTAFGLNLSADQVAAIQVTAEALLQMFVPSER